MSGSICRASDLIVCQAQIDTRVGLGHVVDQQNGAVLFKLHLVLARIDVRMLDQLAGFHQIACPFTVRFDEIGQLLLVVFGSQSLPADNAVRERIGVYLTVKLGVQAGIDENRFTGLDDFRWICVEEWMVRICLNFFLYLGRDR